MNLLYNFAKSYIDKIDKERGQSIDQLKKDHEERIKSEHNRRNYIMVDFFNLFEGIKKEEFIKNNLPRFSIDETVVINWYGQGDSWEGHIANMMKHTPYRGPIKVKITHVILDTQLLHHKLEIAFDRGVFNGLPLDFDLLSSAFEKELMDDYLRHGLCKYVRPDPIVWAYKILVEGDDNRYWGYAISERKFLKEFSEEARLSIEAWESDLKIQKMTKEIEKENAIRGVLLKRIQPL